MIDITKQIRSDIKQSGIVNVYVQGATAGIIIRENRNDSVQEDVLDLLKKLILKGI